MPGHIRNTATECAVSDNTYGHCGQLTDRVIQHAKVGGALPFAVTNVAIEATDTVCKV
jgi:hypothetical protein